MFDEPTLEELTRFRRDLHEIPEVDFDLPETISYIRDVLQRLPCELVEPCRSTLCAFFPGRGARTIGVRTDMDALPVIERTDAPYRSRHEGKMHACGHDGHMAMALGLCLHLAHLAGAQKNNVLVVFQPAEETSGGARLICESGVFERFDVSCLVGFHLWPSIPKDRVVSCPGPMLAGTSFVDIRFHGRASHIARASEGADSLEAAARFLAEAYDYVTAEQGDERWLLKLGTCTSGTAFNIIPSETRLTGALRTFSQNRRIQSKRDLTEIAQRRARDTGCTVDALIDEYYPPVVNDPDLFERISAVVPDLGTLPESLLIAEDFAWYQQFLPAVFMLLGTGTGIPLHADTFDFDESVLMTGLGIYERLVELL